MQRKSKLAMTQREDKDRIKVAREQLGKFFYDLAKTSFLVMVAGNAVMLYDEGEFKLVNVLSALVGILLTIVFACIANEILKRK